MPRIRSEQIQDLTIRDINLAPDANIDQSKIESWETDIQGWLSKGIIKAVQTEYFTDNGQQTFADFWDGTQAGQLYFNISTDEMYIGTSADPFYNLVAGYGLSAVNGHDRDIIVQMGTDATDYGGPGANLGTTFNLGVDLATDGTNLDLYLNGALMEEATDGDFQVIGPQTIQFDFDVYGEDKITAIVVTDANFSNYATKSYVDNLLYGESGHTHDGVDSVQLNFNEAMEQSEIEALTKADHLGSTDMSAGFDWGTTPQSFSINPNSTGEKWLVLDALTSSTAEVVTLINNKFSAENVTNFEAYSDGNFVGIRALSIGNSYSFILGSGAEDALTTLGMIAGSYNGTSSMGILINHTLYPTTTTRNLGTPSNPWGNVYANEGHFSATSIWIDNAKMQFNTTDGSLEISEDGGATFAKVAKRSTETEPAVMDAGTGQKVVLESDTGIEFVGNIIPDVASSRDIGSALLPFSSVYADEIFLSGSSLYVNGKKVLADNADTMTFSTDPNQAMMIKTEDDAGSRGNANLTLNSANDLNFDSIGDMSFTTGATLTDKNIAFVNNSTNGNITFNADGNSLISYSSIEPGTDGDLHIGAEGKAFNDIYVNTVLFRPLAGASDFAKIDSEVVDTSTLVKHQIGSSSADSIVFQSNDGTSISNLLTITGDGKVTISGDLFVDGTTTTVNSTNTQVSDSTFIIHSSDTPIDGDAAFEVQRDGTAVDITKVTSVADVDGSLSSTSWSIYSHNDVTQYYVWYYMKESDPTPASHTGTADLSTGFDWVTTPQDFSIDVNGTGPLTVSLNSTTTDIATVVAEINSAFTTAGVDGVLAYDASPYIEISTVASGSTQSFTLATGTTDALVTLGMTAGTYTGVDDVYSTDPVGVGTGIRVDIVKNDSAASVSHKTASVLDSNSDFNATAINNDVKISNTVDNTAVTAADSDTGFTITTVQENSGNRNAKISWNDSTHRWEAVYGVNAEYTRDILDPKTVDGVNFHSDDLDPVGTTRLNMDGYFYATRVYNAVYNDLAEFMPKAAESEPGDVLIMTDKGLMPSSSRLDGAVVGVHSDTYGYALGAEDSDNKLPVAISGRVWVKIAEPCNIGDLLVSGQRGRATVKRAGDDITGKVIGKVLKNKENFEEERIEMLVMNS